MPSLVSSWKDIESSSFLFGKFLGHFYISKRACCWLSSMYRFFISLVWKKTMNPCLKLTSAVKNLLMLKTINLCKFCSSTFHNSAAAAAA